MSCRVSRTHLPPSAYCATLLGVARTPCRPSAPLPHLLPDTCPLITTWCRSLPGSCHRQRYYPASPLRRWPTALCLHPPLEQQQQQPPLVARRRAPPRRRCPRRRRARTAPAPLRTTVRGARGAATHPPTYPPTTRTHAPAGAAARFRAEVSRRAAAGDAAVAAAQQRVIEIRAEAALLVETVEDRAQEARGCVWMWVGGWVGAFGECMGGQRVGGCGGWVGVWGGQEPGCHLDSPPPPPHIRRQCGRRSARRRRQRLRLRG